MAFRWVPSPEVASGDPQVQILQSMVRARVPDDAVRLAELEELARANMANSSADESAAEGVSPELLLIVGREYGAPLALTADVAAHAVSMHRTRIVMPHDTSQRTEPGSSELGSLLAAAFASATPRTVERRARDTRAAALETQLGSTVQSSASAPTLPVPAGQSARRSSTLAATPGHRRRSQRASVSQLGAGAAAGAAAGSSPMRSRRMTSRRLTAQRAELQAAGLGAAHDEPPAQPEPPAHAPAPDAPPPPPLAGASPTAGLARRSPPVSDYHRHLADQIAQASARMRRSRSELAHPAFGGKDGYYRQMLVQRLSGRSGGALSAGAGADGGAAGGAVQAAAAHLAAMRLNPVEGWLDTADVAAQKERILGKSQTLLARKEEERVTAAIARAARGAAPSGAGPGLLSAAEAAAVGGGADGGADGGGGGGGARSTSMGSVLPAGGAAGGARGGAGAQPPPAVTSPQRAAGGGSRNSPQMPSRFGGGRRSSATLPPLAPDTVPATLMAALQAAEAAANASLPALAPGGGAAPLLPGARGAHKPPSRERAGLHSRGSSDGLALEPARPSTGTSAGGGSGAASSVVTRVMLERVTSSTARQPSSALLQPTAAAAGGGGAPAPPVGSVAAALVAFGAERAAGGGPASPGDVVALPAPPLAPRAAIPVAIVPPPPEGEDEGEGAHGSRSPPGHTGPPGGGAPAFIGSVPAALVAEGGSGAAG